MNGTLQTFKQKFYYIPSLRSQLAGAGYFFFTDRERGTREGETRRHLLSPLVRARVFGISDFGLKKPTPEAQAITLQVRRLVAMQQYISFRVENE